MRIVLVSLFAFLAACTRQNPQACCTDAVDCMNVGLPVGTTCEEGRLCRGNRCVEESCTTTGDCDLTAPYCVKTDEGRCSETCNADTECPGFGQAQDDKFCVAGGCVQCRDATDCPVEASICSPSGQCVGCVAHDDCTSGVCASGMCAAADQVAHVATNGSPSSDCTVSAPCNTIARALTLNPPRPYIVIGSGTYTSTTTITPTGVRWLIGKGSSRPVLTRSTDGPIFTIDGIVDIKLERLEVFGAKRSATSGPRGHGIVCGGTGSGLPKLELMDMLVHLNDEAGLQAIRCVIKATKSEFANNMSYGVESGEGSSVYDRVLVLSNGSTGMFMDAGIHRVTNSIIARNAVRGIDIYSTSSGNVIEFNTIVDNGHGSKIGTGVQCDVSPTNLVGANNLVARNEPTQVNGCDFSNSIVVDSNIAPLKFKHPDSPPYDYHLLPGSSALDLGSISTIKVDFDGEARPAGGANDIGADELH